ncbi:MAG: Ig-like domain-containing protein [Chromatiales bacterium]|nr:Ig-like domain-containing protein [Chromatiales bacterium]
MNKIRISCLAMVAAFLAACGGSGNSLTSPPSDDPGVPGAPGTTVAALQLLTSSTQLPSDKNGINKVTLTALVRDANNVVLSGVPVIFSATSGAVSFSPADDANNLPITNSSGAATAELTNGLNPENRPITVTAQAQNISTQVVVNVTGTTLTITGPNALAQGDSGTYLVVLRDANGAGIDGRTVTIESANGNTLSSPSLTTGSGGEVQITLTATVGGIDTLTASALGLAAQRTINVSDDSFVFTVPTSGAELGLSPASHPVSVEWTKAGVPQAGETITFTSTRGTLSAGSAVTNASGVATVQLSSSSAGPAAVTAANSEGTSTTRQIEFVADDPEEMILQAAPFTIPTGQQSTVTAILRDAGGNLVKNTTVVFELTDTTGGFISVATDVTDSQGRARTFYTGGSTASEPNGVSIRAFVQNKPAVEAQVQLTVAQQARNISLGTGNTLFEITPAVFGQEWAIIVTDATGAAVANEQVDVSLRSLDYYLGSLVVQGNSWVRPPVGAGTLRCANEDPDNTNNIDAPTVTDNNNNGRIEPGNIAAVVPVPADAPVGSCSGAPGTSAIVTTNNQGIARVCVLYPKNYNLWLDVRIEAKAVVASGTEFSRAQGFLLPGLAADLANINATPPGVVSPFGPVTPEGCTAPPPE